MIDNYYHDDIYRAIKKSLFGIYLLIIFFYLFATKINIIIIKATLPTDLIRERLFKLLDVKSILNFVSVNKELRSFAGIKLDLLCLLDFGTFPFLSMRLIYY